MSDRDPSDLSPHEGCPVHDWATDFDVMDEGYIKDPAPVWEELRDTCPIAHTTRWGGREAFLVCERESHTGHAH